MPEEAVVACLVAAALATTATTTATTAMMAAVPAVSVYLSVLAFSLLSPPSVCAATELSSPSNPVCSYFVAHVS